jgi:hypothetical protein
MDPRSKRGWTSKWWGCYGIRGFYPNHLGSEAPHLRKKEKAINQWYCGLHCPGQEGVGFKKIMKILEPGYTVPKRETYVCADHKIC